MKRFALSLAILLAAGLSLSAQTIDRAKIRAAVYLPEVSCIVKMGWDDGGARDARGKRIDQAADVTKYHAQLNGSAADGATYLKLAGCYAALKDEPRRLDACRRAEQILQPYRETQDPMKAELVTHYSAAIRALGGEGSTARCEEYARRAVRLNPKCWLCRGELGWVCLRKIVLALGAEETTSFEMNKLMQAIARRRPSPEQLDAATKALDEARDCFAQIHRLAPREYAALTSCFNFAASELILGQLLEGLRGRGPRNTADMVQPAGRLATELAELSDDHICWQAQAATFTVLEDLARAPVKGGEKPVVSPQCCRAIQKYLDRLAKGTRSTDTETAAYCHAMIATLHITTGDEAAFFTHARRAALLDPSLTVISEALEGKLLGDDDPAALAVSRDRLRRAPTARNYFLTAKTLALLGRVGESEWLLRTALEKHPDDLYCMLGLAATLLLQERDDAQPEVKELLLRGYRLVRPETPPALRRDGAMLWVAMQALSGDLGTAQTLLRRWEQTEPNGERIKRLREALGPPTIVPAGFGGVAPPPP